MKRQLQTLSADLVPLLLESMRAADRAKAECAVGRDLLAQAREHCPPDLRNAISLHIGRTR